MVDAVYYEKPVLLHRDTHRNRKVAASMSFAFARKANSLYLAGAEFGEAAREYPIVFTQMGARWYGFAPVKLPKGMKFADMFHGHNERIPVDGLRWGTETLTDLLVRFAGV